MTVVVTGFSPSSDQRDALSSVTLHFSLSLLLDHPLTAFQREWQHTTNVTFLVRQSDRLNTHSVCHSCVCSPISTWLRECLVTGYITNNSSFRTNSNYKLFSPRAWPATSFSVQSMTTQPVPSLRFPPNDKSSQLQAFDERLVSHILYKITEYTTVEVDKSECVSFYSIHIKLIIWSFGWRVQVCFLVSLKRLTCWIAQKVQVE